MIKPPVAASHSLTVLSFDADASCLPIWREDYGLNGARMALRASVTKHPNGLLDTWQSPYPPRYLVFKLLPYYTLPADAKTSALQYT